MPRNRPLGPLDIPGPQHEIRAAMRRQGERFRVARVPNPQTPKLSIAQVQEIHHLLASTDLPHEQIAEMYDVSRSTVSRISRVKQCGMAPWPEAA